MFFFRRGGGNIFNGKSTLIFLLVAFAFFQLFQFRNNDPLPEGIEAPETRLKTLNGEVFTLEDVGVPVVMIFFAPYGIMNNNMYTTLYKRMIPKLQVLHQDGNIMLVVLVKDTNTAEEAKELIADEDYAFLKDVIYVTDTERVARMYGVQSWPHLFLLDRGDRVLYQAKIPSAEKVTETIRGN